MKYKWKTVSNTLLRLVLFCGGVACLCTFGGELLICDRAQGPKWLAHQPPMWPMFCDPIAGGVTRVWRRHTYHANSILHECIVNLLTSLRIVTLLRSRSLNRSIHPVGSRGQLAFGLGQHSVDSERSAEAMAAPGAQEHRT